jgi:hypothetical protein
MSVWDWVEVGLSDHHTEIEGMKGSFAVTAGDAVSGFFGARHAHIFGSEIKLVCDPEDMLWGKVEHYLPGVAAVLGGIGGQATFVYGSNITATYVGPKVEIRRAPVVNKTSDYVLPMVKKPGANPPADAVDPAMAIAVGALSTLLCAVPAALEMVLAIKYKGHLPDDDDSIPKMKLAAYMITTRMMALLKLLEDKGSWAQFAEQWGKELALLLACVGVAVAAAIPIHGWVLLYIAAAEGTLKEVFTSLTEALKED